MLFHWWPYCIVSSNYIWKASICPQREERLSDMKGMEAVNPTSAKKRYIIDLFYRGRGGGGPTHSPPLLCCYVQYCRDRVMWRYFRGLIWEYFADIYYWWIHIGSTGHVPPPPSPPLHITQQKSLFHHLRNSRMYYSVNAHFVYIFIATCFLTHCDFN